LRIFFCFVFSISNGSDRNQNAPSLPKRNSPHCDLWNWPVGDVYFERSNSNKWNLIVLCTIVNRWASIWQDYLPQTREQTLGGTFLWYEKSILGCWQWVGLGCGIKGLGRLWATFEEVFFNFLWAKKKKKKKLKTFYRPHW
jgi:hypothetical protein